MKNNQLLEIVFNNIMDISYTCNDVALSFDKYSIPLSSLKEVIENSKITTENKEIKSFMRTFNNMLDDLFKELNDNEDVSIYEIKKQCILLYGFFEETINSK